MCGRLRSLTPGTFHPGFWLANRVVKCVRRHLDSGFRISAAGTPRPAVLGMRSTASREPTAGLEHIYRRNTSGR